MSGFRKRADDWLARNNGLTTVVFLGIVISPIVWLFSSADPSPQKVDSPKVTRREPVPVAIKSGAVLCYERVDWENLLGASRDDNLNEIRQLLNSGRCLKVTVSTKALYLEPITSGVAFIQMPSGRGAFLPERALLK